MARDCGNFVHGGLGSCGHIGSVFSVVSEII